MEVERKQEKEAGWMDLKAIEERKVAIVEEMLRLLGEEVLTKKKSKITRLFMDTTSLHDTQRAYVDAMRGQILASMMNWIMRGNEDFGEGGSRSV
ncbi:hypothetical protein E2562_001591 [Oryza meyeriana var. granulata]|uniref:Uncharacterized protein n=1 Tax=Oryza meyeriana var. granulata TaxID=110450 RepID=A0A6G1CB30_9ORYZ|nr:hypothetical protein E2562_001591 [Oryza meyeriana var. granulata]